MNWPKKKPTRSKRYSKKAARISHAKRVEAELQAGIHGSLGGFYRRWHSIWDPIEGAPKPIRRIK